MKSEARFKGIQANYKNLASKALAGNSKTWTMGNQQITAKDDPSVNLVLLRNASSTIVLSDPDDPSSGYVNIYAEIVAQGWCNQTPPYLQFELTLFNSQQGLLVDFKTPGLQVLCEDNGRVWTAKTACSSSAYNDVASGHFELISTTVMGRCP